MGRNEQHSGGNLCAVVTVRHVLSNMVTFFSFPRHIAAHMHDVQDRDVQEGADILMVKPGLPYLDVVRMVKQKVCHCVCI